MAAYVIRISDWSADVCDSDLVCPGIRIGHDLDGQGPARMIAAGDRLEQIAAVEVGIAARHLRCFGVCEERHALIRMEMVLHPEFLAGGIDPHVDRKSVV